MQESARLPKPNMFFSRRTWLTAIVLTLLLSAILLLPFPWRDVMLFATFLAAIGLAWFDLDETWLGFLMVLPLVRLSGGLFQNNGLILSRLIVVGITIVLVVKQRDAPALRAVLRSNGFRWFGLFVLANVIAALAVFKAESVFTALTYLEPLLFFAVSYCLVRMNPAIERRIVSALVVGGVILGVVGLYEITTQQSVASVLYPILKAGIDVYLYGANSDRFGLGGRISSLIGQPVNTSIYFAFIIIAALYHFFVHERPRWIAAPIVIIGGVLVLATGTRGGLLGLAAGLLLLAALGPRTWRERLVVAGVLVGGALLTVLLLPKMASYLADSTAVGRDVAAARNITGRIALTLELLRIFREHWLLGYGPGLVQKQAMAGILPTVEGIKTLGGIENQYATILADGGIVAGVAYLGFMVSAVWQAIQIFREPRWRAMGLTLLALFAAYFVFAATETALTSIPNLVLMAIFGAFAAQFEGARND